MDSNFPQAKLIRAGSSDDLASFSLVTKYIHYCALCFYGLQVTGAQTAVSCVRVAHLVKTVLKDVTVRMVQSAPVRMGVVIAHQVS